MKVRDRWPRFAAHGAAALFVAHDDSQLLRRTMLADLDPLPFPVLVDADRHAYRTWGLGRIPWWRLWLDPRVWQRYARLLTGGERVRGAGRDTQQLGGDFVIAADGRVAYSRPQHRDDRPAVGRLLSVVADLDSGRPGPVEAAP